MKNLLFIDSALLGKVRTNKIEDHPGSVEFPANTCFPRGGPTLAQLSELRKAMQHLKCLVYWTLTWQPIAVLSLETSLLTAKHWLSVTSVWQVSKSWLFQGPYYWIVPWSRRSAPFCPLIHSSTPTKGSLSAASHCWVLDPGERAATQAKTSPLLWEINLCLPDQQVRVRVSCPQKPQISL